MQLLCFKIISIIDVLALNRGARRSGRLHRQNLRNTQRTPPPTQNDEFAKIIYWAPSGTEFVIKDVSKLQQVVLPRYFRHAKMNSFIRQLNMYGFHKSRNDHVKSVFSHPLFQRDRR